MSIRVILADDHTMIREGLRAVLRKHPDIEVVSEADNGRTAVQAAKKFRPDIVILDVFMPGLNGIEAARRMAAASPGTKTIALSMHSGRRFVAEMFKAGASGYLLKDCASEELVNAIRAVMAGRNYLSPHIAKGALRDIVGNGKSKDASAWSVLTPREREMLQLLSEGKTVKQIATALHISVKTVETHRLHIMSKLNIRTLAELTRYALREGLTSL
ncbi:MAG TPA: response regulator transcription factor [Nitrospirota bacterium]|jgi:DNA-binding NarL/FixJ family response regulator